MPESQPSTKAAGAHAGGYTIRVSMIRVRVSGPRHPIWLRVELLTAVMKCSCQFAKVVVVGFTCEVEVYGVTVETLHLVQQVW